MFTRNVIFLFVIQLFCKTIFAFHLHNKSVLTKNYKQIDGYIVGGKDAEEGEFPYQVSLQKYGSHICGASIISSEWVVTAAHCIEGNPTEILSIRYGSIHHDSGGEVAEAIETVAHPSYSDWTLNNDIALIRTKTPIKLNSNTIKAIPLPAQDSDVTAGQSVAITGWGYTTEGVQILAPILQKITLPAVERSVCREIYKDYNEVTESMICAGIPEGGVDACQGDSGGPAVVNGILVGAVSWGYGDYCARPELYGIYTRIAKFRDWIKIKTLI